LDGGIKKRGLLNSIAATPRVLDVGALKLAGHLRFLMMGDHQSVQKQGT